MITYFVDSKLHNTMPFQPGCTRGVIITRLQPLLVNTRAEADVFLSIETQ